MKNVGSLEGEHESRERILSGINFSLFHISKPFLNLLIVLLHFIKLTFVFEKENYFFLSLNISVKNEFFKKLLKFFSHYFLFKPFYPKI